MSPDRAVLLSAPATLPERLDERAVDAELLDLLCEDGEWLEETFRGIVATSWVEPPRGGESRLAARPRRHGTRGRRRSERAVPRASQWVARPRGRQRSPPVVTTR